MKLEGRCGSVYIQAPGDTILVQLSLSAPEIDLSITTRACSILNYVHAERYSKKERETEKKFDISNRQKNLRIELG